MRIFKSTSSQTVLQQQQQELIDVIDCLSDDTNRSCQHCSRACSCSKSIDCNCDCSKSCPHISMGLSSEENTFPIESHILPLVYALNKMNIFQTCWSCEGHTDANGKLNKLPQVWFYSNSMMLLRVMGDCISLLKSKNITHYNWQLVISYAARDSEMNAFSLKPDLNFVATPELALLRQDILNIAQHLPKNLEQGCRGYYQDISALLSAQSPQSVRANAIR